MDMPLTIKEEATKPAIQLRLLPTAKPLTERLGTAFFRHLPTGPGIYLMGGERERLLYIGKAKNLRARLNAYRHIQPERASRKLVRLVHEVRTIAWETCSTPEAALLLENELLRLHKPKYNVMNTRPEHYLFIGCRVCEDKLHLRLTKEYCRLPGETLHGAFKSLGRTRCGIHSLLRLIWITENLPKSAYDIPAPLCAERCPIDFGVKMMRLDPVHLEDILRRLLDGEDDAMCKMKHTVAEMDIGEVCLRNLCRLDLEKLELFYKFGPARNRNLRVACGYENEIVAQTDLDDLLVLGHGND